ncbi:MAG: type IVB secretion system protein IcmG/DotF [Legionellales bacterium]|nr:type IVB secretion system protein IcmG/DotF [Legionellales bacterium]
MADDDQNTDDYQFADMDSVTPGSEHSEEGASSKEETEEQRPAAEGNKNYMKNRILLVGGLFILMVILFKWFGFFSGGKKEIIQPKTPIPISAPAAVVSQGVPPVMQELSPPPNVSEKVNEKLTLLESTQQTMQTDVSTVNAQMGDVNKSVQSLLAKMTELNQAMVNLSTKVDQQSHEIEQLTQQRQAIRKPPHVVRRASSHYPTYHLQAVIPGRAWLIAGNGATLTVREGTVVAGYGMVKLIDATEGRVTTSSGLVIRFAQNDS